MPTIEASMPACCMPHKPLNHTRDACPLQPSSLAIITLIPNSRRPKHLPHSARVTRLRNLLSPKRSPIMSTKAPLTYEKLDSCQSSFLELPEEIRHMVYTHYFADNKQYVYLFLSNGAALPCEAHHYYKHVIEPRLKRPGEPGTTLAETQ